MDQVTLKHVEKPTKVDVNEDLDWIIESFGFFSERDKERTAARIFHALIDSLIKRVELTSEQIAETCGVSRGTAIYHINNYISSGMIIRRKTHYSLRTRSLEKTVEEIEQDTIKIFSDLKKIARDIDQSLGFIER